MNIENPETLNKMNEQEAMSIVDTINDSVRAIKSFDTGGISDGYHTFDELYYHRMVMFSIICKMNISQAWRSKLHHDGTMYDDYFIVGLTTEQGQYSYHYHMDYWDNFDGVDIMDKAPEFDGHKPEDIGRLNSTLEQHKRNQEV